MFHYKRKIQFVKNGGEDTYYGNNYEDRRKMKMKKKKFLEFNHESYNVRIMTHTSSNIDSRALSLLQEHLALI